jgi:hypothetical protein
MKRLALSVAALAMALAATVSAAAPTVAGAAELVPGVAAPVDLAASSVANPGDSVSPPGALVLYSATFANESAIAVAGTFTNTTTNGTLVTATSTLPCTIPAVGTANPAISCSATLEPGQSFQLRVQIQSPTTAGVDITNVSRAALAPSAVQFVDLVTENDSSTLTTPVTLTTLGGSAGFVPEGGTLAWRKHVLTVEEAELGIVAFMSDTVSPRSYDCGGVPCEQGLHLDYDQSDEFFGKVSVDVNFGFDDPCRNVTPEKCHPLYFFKDGVNKAFEACSATNPSMCTAGSYRVKVGTGFEYHYVVKMTTKDPDILTPVKSLVNGQA